MHTVGGAGGFETAGLKGLYDLFYVSIGILVCVEALDVGHAFAGGSNMIGHVGFELGGSGEGDHGMYGILWEFKKGT